MCVDWLVTMNLHPPLLTRLQVAFLKVRSVFLRNNYNFYTGFYFCWTESSLPCSLTNFEYCPWNNRVFNSTHDRKVCFKQQLSISILFLKSIQQVTSKTNQLDLYIGVFRHCCLQFQSSLNKIVVWRYILVGCCSFTNILYYCFHCVPNAHLRTQRAWV